MPEKTDLPEPPAHSPTPTAVSEATLLPASAEPAVLTPEPSLPEALPIPARWSQLTLAFSPACREMLVLDKTVPEDSDDPEATVLAWQAAADATDRKITADQETTRLSQHLDPTDGLLVYSAQLWKAGQPVASVAFHASLTHAFSEAGAWDAPEKLEAAIRNGITHPLTRALQAVIKREAPGSPVRTPRVEAGTPKAIPQPQPNAGPEQPEGS